MSFEDVVRFKLLGMNGGFCNVECIHMSHISSLHFKSLFIKTLLLYTHIYISWLLSVGMGTTVVSRRIKGHAHCYNSVYCLRLL